jgi:pentatricopeptide repeat protein
MNKTHTRGACSALLTQCVRTGYLAHAQELRNLRGASAFSVASLNLLLATCAKQGSVARGTLLLNDMLERNAVTYEIAANMYARAGDARACRELVLEMSTTCPPVTRGVLLAVMDVCVTHGDAKACEEIFEKLRSESDGTSAVYDKMLTLYGNAGDLQKARDTWELMITQGTHLRKVCECKYVLTYIRDIAKHKQL